MNFRTKKGLIESIYITDAQQIMGLRSEGDSMDREMRAAATVAALAASRNRGLFVALSFIAKPLDYIPCLGITVYYGTKG